jgi:RNA polymerase sigma-70 factor (ECF subfamily)
LAERDLVEQAKGGDGVAFDRLVRPYLDVAFRTAYLVTRDAADAEDATQAALIRAFTHLDTFRATEPFRPWLLRIVANDARNVVRSRVRRRSDPLPNPDETRAGEADDPTFALEALERSAWLVSHINTLDEPDRIVIYSRYALDLTEAEMAAVLDCPRGTVKSRLHRALARLRTRIEAEGTEVRP